MFKIILESVEGKRLGQVSEENNAEYLQQDENEFKLLGDLSTCSYDVFSAKDMDCLIIELMNLQKIRLDSKEIKHLEDIINLARECKKTEGSRMIFTPFDE